MPEYRFLFGEDFLIQGFQKYRKQHGTRCVFIAIKSVASILLVALVAFAVAHRIWGLTIFLIALVILIFNGHRMDFWLFKRRFRKSPYRNENIIITLTADGFHAVGLKSNSKLTWAAFTKARRFRDGFLLFQGPGLFNWLPDAALAAGAAAEVAYLIEANVKDYKIVEQQVGQVSSETALSDEPST